ncbi:MAG: VWA domain-containing protein [Candidatus Acidiferrales bacterium]
MKLIPAWTVAAILAFPAASISEAQVQPQSQSQSQTPPAQAQTQTQSQDQTPAAVHGKSQPQQGTPAQKQEQSQRPRRPLGAVSELVRVPVTVKNNQGVIIGDLRRDEFRLFEDGKEVPIALFSTDPYPLSVVVVLDNDLTVRVRDQVQKSLESIAGGLGPQDETALVVFDEFPQVVHDFTKNNDELFTELKRMRLGDSFPGDAGGPMTAGPQINNQSQLPQVPTYGIRQEKVVKDLDDAVHSAGEMLQARGGDRRRMIFLIADGQNSHHNQWTYDLTLRLLLTADVSVYSITVGTKLLKHEPGRMTRYPQETGGDSFFASKENSLDRLYSAVTEEARNQYLLGYVPQNPESGEYHAIEVRIERPGLNVTARKGYYYAPPKP